MLKRSFKNCERLRQAGYVLYDSKKFCIVKHYNNSGKAGYLQEMGKCLWMLVYGIISIVGFPSALIFTLYGFIPKVYIKDYKE